MTMDALISPTYRAEQVRLHALPKSYGGRGKKWSTRVNTLVWLHACESVLDYGCGRGSLRESLILAGRSKEIREYDPAIPGKDTLPQPADLVVCTDVLEHVEADKIDAVLAHLKALTRRVLFLVVALTETAHTLSDGRQAHILLRPVAWWQARLAAHGWTIVEEVIPTKPEKQWAVVLRPTEALC